MILNLIVYLGLRNGNVLEEHFIYRTCEFHFFALLSLF